MTGVRPEESNPLYAMNERERRHASVLIVDSDLPMRNGLRQALTSLGFEDVSDANDYASALEKMDGKKITHVIFEARTGAMPAQDFLASALDKNNLLIAIPSSCAPTVDDIFDLLIGGARGYIVKPFTSGTLDEVIVWATKGEHISDAILHTRNRNEALASLVLEALDRLAVVTKQACKFQTARFEVPKRKAILRRTMEMARTFAKGGDPELRSTLVELAIERGENRESRYASFRKRERRAARLKQAAKPPEPPPPEAPPQK